MEDYIGEVIRPEPEEKPTKFNTVICNAVFYTTSTRRKHSVSIVNQGQPKRTLTLTITHTEVREWHVIVVAGQTKADLKIGY